MRAHVEGTVTLYAIIRADGTVDGVKILRGVDDTLDENASRRLVALAIPSGNTPRRGRGPGSGGAHPFAARNLPF